jgi:hypothetical protein
VELRSTGRDRTLRATRPHGCGAHGRHEQRCHRPRPGGTRWLERGKAERPERRVGGRADVRPQGVRSPTALADNANGRRARSDTRSGPAKAMSAFSLPAGAKRARPSAERASQDHHSTMAPDCANKYAAKTHLSSCGGVGRRYARRDIDGNRGGRSNLPGRVTDPWSGSLVQHRARPDRQGPRGRRRPRP